MTEPLSKIIAQYREQYGEPEYRYFKIHVSWSKPRRQRGRHFMPIGPGTTVTKEEYEANIAESNRLVGEAFMGRCTWNYWRYDREMVKDGWREVLIKEIQAA